MYTNLRPVMDQVPFRMRSGTGIGTMSESEDPALQDWLRQVEAVLLVLERKAWESAVRYARAANRNDVTPDDCHYASKYEIRTFLHADDMEERFHEMYQRLIPPPSSARPRSNVHARTQDNTRSCPRHTHTSESSDDPTRTYCHTSSSSGYGSDGDACDSSESEDGDVVVPTPPRLGEARSDLEFHVMGPEWEEIVGHDVPQFTRAPDTDPFAKQVNHVVDHWDEWNPTDMIERILKTNMDAAHAMYCQDPRPDVVYRRRRSMRNDS